MDSEIATASSSGAAGVVDRPQSKVASKVREVRKTLLRASSSHRLTNTDKNLNTIASTGATTTSSSSSSSSSTTSRLSKALPSEQKTLAASPKSEVRKSTYATSLSNSSQNSGSELSTGADLTKPRNDLTKPRNNRSQSKQPRQLIDEKNSTDNSNVIGGSGYTDEYKDGGTEDKPYGSDADNTLKTKLLLTEEMRRSRKVSRIDVRKDVKVTKRASGAANIR